MKTVCSFCFKMEILPSSIDQFLTLKTGYFTGFIIMTELSPSVLTNTFKKKKKKKSLSF